MKVFVVGDLSVHALANSFVRAFRAEGHEVAAFDLGRCIQKYVLGGRIGRKIHTFWPVEAWLRKGNRELAVRFQQERPDVVLVCGNTPISYGVLAFWKSVSTARLVLYWPDTLTNLTQDQFNCVPFYDVVATYSAATLEAFLRLGCSKTTWLPFAGDQEFIGIPTKAEPEYAYDLTFAGGWRPEREKALSAAARAFPHLRIHVRGTYWRQNCKDARLFKEFNPAPLYGEGFGDLIRASRINLNVIDDTNFPAANMRFFEVPTAGGLQLCSPCPEQESVFLHGKHLLYFSSEDALVEQIGQVLARPDHAADMRREGHALAAAEHTYRHRVNHLLSGQD